jgi:AmiR/NasT family two-component response regulator
LRSEETLKARRDVDKAVVWSRSRRSEGGSLELIRQQATQKRLSMAQIATTIIGAQEVLGGLGLMGDTKE